MSRSLTSLINTNTFEDWFIRTNEIIDTLEKVATLDNIYDDNVGDLTINGTVSATSINADNLNLGLATSQDTISLNANARIKGDLEIADDYGSGQTASLRFYNGKEAATSSPTWAIQVDPDDEIQHRRLTIGVGAGNPSAQTPLLYIDAEDGEINGQNVVIHDDLLPDEITSNITGDVTGDLNGNATTATTATYVTTLSSDASTKLKTDLLDEGTTNKFYTSARAQADAKLAISASGDLSYADGVVSYSGPTDAQVRTKISVDGSLDYDEESGVISYTERTDAAIRGLFSSGTGVSIATDGKISIGQSVSTSANVTFASHTSNKWALKKASDGTTLNDTVYVEVQQASNGNYRLVFKYGNEVLFSMDGDGNFRAKGDITAFGTPI